MSPAIALEALFASFIINAHEGRAVQNFDIIGEYLHASPPDDKIFHMKLEVELVDMVCRVNPKKNITYEKGKKVLYVRILKAIYGIIYSALLLYELLSTKLSDLGFKLNPYKFCI